MKTLALANGDLVAGPGGYATISGAAKVQQEIALDLGEEYGHDRFHPDTWGSTVMNYIGQPIDDSVELDVRSEIARTLAQYIATQQQEVYRDFVNGSRSRYSANDVVVGVSSISSSINDTSILISLILETQDGSTIEVNRTVSQ